jgi:hypothetical protein
LAAGLRGKFFSTSFSPWGEHTLEEKRCEQRTFNPKGPKFIPGGQSSPLGSRLKTYLEAPMSAYGDMYIHPHDHATMRVTYVDNSTYYSFSAI